MTQRKIAIEILKRLQQAGHESFFVGGCVRDLLRGVMPEDYDIATGARPEQVQSLFSKTIGVGKNYGVIIVLQDGEQFEVATFRAEDGYQDGRRPTEVLFSDAKTDASRRDFTVNGLFFDPVTGTVHDWVGGRKDLKQRIIRAIGQPKERFTEDHLRLLRA
ncbi:MAG: CCA tRNA nucleotidyltransferase, partial [Verrucomicrobiota bacterium]|nr:CCA tRNA nucleotidyltransferase [Verrucomicrobiota bacterium]